VSTYRTISTVCRESEIESYFTIKPSGKFALPSSAIPGVQLILFSSGSLYAKIFNSSKLLQKGNGKICLDLSSLLYKYCCKMNSRTCLVTSYSQKQNSQPLEFNQNAKFEVHTEVTMKITVLWNVTA
jgi:hypothetical protein